tara:strand:- start:2008 stop:2547 length:540 start_codon:yes stop_codon:yes gene_type:complete
MEPSTLEETREVEARRENQNMEDMEDDDLDIYFQMLEDDIREGNDTGNIVEVDRDDVADIDASNIFNPEGLRSIPSELSLGLLTRIGTLSPDDYFNMHGGYPRDLDRFNRQIDSQGLAMQDMLRARINMTPEQRAQDLKRREDQERRREREERELPPSYRPPTSRGDGPPTYREFQNPF